MIPSFHLLDDETIKGLLSRARAVLADTGIAVEESEITALLADNGARVDSEKSRVFITDQMIDKALESAPNKIRLYDRSRREVAVLGETHGYFVPGSSALNLFDADAMKAREAKRDDLDKLALLTEQIPTFAIQSTALVPSDVPQAVADSVRLFHALTGCTKPIVTGTFHDDGFLPMVRMLEAVRGSAEDLREYPFAIFDCCPTPPLKWPRLTSVVLVESARRGIPAEIIPVPLCGATGPVTLYGSLVQIAAENLSGIVINQCVAPGAPVIWGGCPMSFDMKYGTTPTGAPETMMLNAASAEIARHLGLPSHGYLTLSDAKSMDTQAGFESAMGALTAALSGLNVVSGAGMMSFIGCQSLEKLVFDAQICLAAKRYGRGIEPDLDTDFPELFSEATSSNGFLSLKHTRKNYRRELSMPSELIDRQGSTSTPSDTFSRCKMAVEKLLDNDPPEPLANEIEQEILEINTAEIAKHR